MSSMDWHAQRAIHIILEIYQMPLIVPKPYFSLFMVALTHSVTTPLKQTSSIKKTLLQLSAEM